MSSYTRAGIVLLVLASACLIGAAVYAEHALRNPEGFTLYPSVAFIVQPVIGSGSIAGFVVVEHLLVASGLWCLRRGILRRAASQDA